MSRVPVQQVLGWLVPTLLCVGLSGIYLFEWRSSREVLGQLASRYRETTQGFNAKFSYESTQTRTLLKGIRASLDGVRGSLEELLSRPAEAAPVEAGREPEEPVEPGPAEDESPWLPEDEAVVAEEDLPELPELPPGTSARHILESFKAREFYADPLFNPDGKELERSDLLRAGNIVTRARGRLMTLQSDLDLFVGENMDVMFEDGLFIEYEKGQERIKEWGVYTSAELLPEGAMRMYYFPPEEYPQIYEIRKELKELPELALRRLMALARRNEGGDP